MTQEPLTEVTLTALDRCDADCPAAARVEVTINGSQLLFCGHHYAQYEIDLTVLTSEILDERHFDIKESQKVLDPA